ncbi:hypothetical protein [Amycolatopsis sp. NPDC004378]
MSDAQPAVREDRYVVHFDHNRQPHPVVAWSQDGEPLILGEHGALVRASDLGVVASVTEREHDHVVPANPGVYLRVRADVGEELRVPVAYWLVDHFGWAKPVPLSNSTYLDPCDESDVVGIEWDDPPGPRR